MHLVVSGVCKAVFESTILSGPTQKKAGFGKPDSSQKNKQNAEDCQSDGG